MRLSQICVIRIVCIRIICNIICIIICIIFKKYFYAFNILNYRSMMIIYDILIPILNQLYNR